ncbi:MAG: hypothetical protein QOH57_689 [Mycobacterium sp.]|jgi:hypothetical protein|nr:hypothetical protein [Mycobacterium sp.]
MTRKRVFAPFVAAAACALVSGIVAAPMAHADALSDIRAAVNNARAGTPCGALNYNVNLEGNAQADVGNKLPGVPPSGKYDGKTAEINGYGDPTSTAVGDLMAKARPLIGDCSYKDFGVGFFRSSGIDAVAVALGEPHAAPKPVEPQTKQCPDGGPVIPVAQQCPAAAPQTKQCPDGGPTVPVADACPVKKVAPTNAVTMTVKKAGLQVNVTVSNTSDLAAQCTYDATEANGLGPAVHRDFNLAAKGSTTLNFPAPLIGQSYNLVSACNANFEGQSVQIGRDTGSA